jgi:hypothetical protein
LRTTRGTIRYSYESTVAKWHRASSLSLDEAEAACRAFDDRCTDGERALSDFTFDFSSASVPLLSIGDMSLYFSPLAWGRFRKLFAVENKFLKHYFTRDRRTAMKYFASLFNDLMDGKAGGTVDRHTLYLFQHSDDGKHYTIREMAPEIRHAPLAAMTLLSLCRKVPLDFHSYRISDYATSFRFIGPEVAPGLHAGADVTFTLGTRGIRFRQLYYTESDIVLLTDVSESMSVRGHDPDLIGAHVAQKMEAAKEAYTAWDHPPDITRAWDTPREMAARFVRACKTRRAHPRLREAMIANYLTQDDLPAMPALLAACRDIYEIEEADQVGRFERALFDLASDCHPPGTGNNTSFDHYVHENDYAEADRYIGAVLKTA